MSRNELIVAICFLFAVVCVTGAGAYVSIRKYERDAIINAQTEIEKSKIVEAEKTKRAHEHTTWFPWN